MNKDCKFNILRTVMHINNIYNQPEELRTELATLHV